MTMTCELCGAMVNVEGSTRTRLTQCTSCKRVYIVMVDVVKESTLDPKELESRKVRNT